MEALFNVGGGFAVVVPGAFGKVLPLVEGGGIGTDTLLEVVPGGFGNVLPLVDGGGIGKPILFAVLLDGGGTSFASRACLSILLSLSIALPDSRLPSFVA